MVASAHPSSEPDNIPLKEGTQKKFVLPQLLPSIPDLTPSESTSRRVQYEALIKGFTAITVAVSIAGIALIPD